MRQPVRQRRHSLPDPSLMKLFKQFSQHFKVRSLQRQFDEQVEEVQRLLADGKVKESGQALLDAERLRKEIENLEGLEEPPPPEQ